MLRGVAGNSALVDLLDAELNRAVAQAGHGDSRRWRNYRHRTREAEQAASTHNLTPFAAAGGVAAAASESMRSGVRVEQGGLGSDRGRAAVFG